MKKIILIIFMLLITGCYDYVEINNLSFIASVGIDYEDNKYKLTVEAINDTNQGEENLVGKGYTISSSGKSLAKAFENMSLKITKIPYYNHLKAVVVSKEVAKNHMEELFEYITRNPKIRNEFFLVIAYDVSPKEILNSTNKNTPIVGEKIVKLIETNIKEYNTTYNLPYEDMLEDILNPYKDAKATVITKDDDNIIIKGIGVFKEYKYQDVLSEVNSSYFNMLNNDSSNITLIKKYDEKPMTIKIHDSKVKYKFKNNHVYVNVSAEGEITENMPNFNLLKEDTYKKLNKDFSKILKDDLLKFFDTIQKHQTDILGIKDKYYKDTKKTNIDVNNINLKVQVKINKKGLIYEAQHE